MPPGNPRRVREGPRSDSCRRCRPTLHPQTLSPKERASPCPSKGTKRQLRAPIAPASLTSSVQLESLGAALASGYGHRPPLPPAPLQPRRAGQHAEAVPRHRPSAPARLREPLSSDSAFHRAGRQLFLLCSRRSPPPTLTSGEEGVEWWPGAGRQGPPRRGLRPRCLACPALRLGDPGDSGGPGVKVLHRDAWRGGRGGAPGVATGNSTHLVFQTCLQTLPRARLGKGRGAPPTLRLRDRKLASHFGTRIRREESNRGNYSFSQGLTTVVSLLAPKSSSFMALTLELEGAAHRQKRPQVSRQLPVARPTPRK